MDYGDKARLISRSIQGASNPANAGDILQSAVQPNKIIVSFGGPIIHVGQQYSTLDTINAQAIVDEINATIDAANQNIRDAATASVLDGGGN